MAISSAKELDHKREIIRATKEIKALEKDLLKLKGKAAEAAQKEISALKEIRKGEREVLKGYQAVTEEYRDQIDLGMVLQKSLRKEKGIVESLEHNQFMLLKYGKSKAKLHVKVAKALSLEVDNTATIQANIENIGTAEYQNLDLTKQILNMRKLQAQTGDELLNITIKNLVKQQNLNEQLKRMHDISEATAEQFLKPVKYMQELVGKIPIIGGLLSKMIPIDKWEDDIKKKIGDSVKRAFNIKEPEVPLDEHQALLDYRKSGLAFQGVSLDAYKTERGIQSDISHETGEQAKGLKKANVKMLALSGVAALVLGAVVKMVAGMFKFANETGFSYAQTVKLGGALAVNAEAVKAMTAEFGNINDITVVHAAQMLRLSKQYGIQEVHSAKILKLQTATSGKSKEQLLTVQREVADMARLEGVSPAAVFESMAADSEAFAKFTKDSGKNLMKAAIQAKKLGLEMSAITGAAEGLLNLEDSLTKQMEASVLLGRDINLDRARSLALAGDISGVQQEIVKAVGGENEWNSMNLIQRKALADAVGLQVSQVSKVVGAQNAVNKSTEEGAKKQWGAVAAGAALGALLLGIIIAAISAFSLGTLTAPALGAAAAGFAGGAVIGAAGGATAGAIYNKTKAAEPKSISGATMNPGTVANVRRGEMSIHAGESAVNTQDFNMAPMIEELKAMRKEMRVSSTDRAEQSRQQINTIRGIGAVQA